MASKSNKRWTDEAEMVLMGLLYAELNPSRELITQFNQVLTALGYDFSERSVRDRMKKRRDEAQAAAAAAVKQSVASTKGRVATKKGAKVVKEEQPVKEEDGPQFDVMDTDEEDVKPTIKREKSDPDDEGGAAGLAV